MCAHTCLWVYMCMGMHVCLEIRGLSWVCHSLGAIYLGLFLYFDHFMSFIILLRVCEHVHTHVQARMLVWRSEVACEG